MGKTFNIQAVSQSKVPYTETQQAGHFVLAIIFISNDIYKKVRVPGPQNSDLRGS